MTKFGRLLRKHKLTSFSDSYRIIFGKGVAILIILLFSLTFTEILEFGFLEKNTIFNISVINFAFISISFIFLFTTFLQKRGFDVYGVRRRFEYLCSNLEGKYIKMKQEYHGVAGQISYCKKQADNGTPLFTQQHILEEKHKFLKHEIVKFELNVYRPFSLFLKDYGKPELAKKIRFEFI